MSDFFERLSSGLRQGAGKAAFEADRLRRINSIRQRIKSLNDEVDRAFSRLGHQAYELYRAGDVGAPLLEACQQLDTLKSQVATGEKEMDRIRIEVYVDPLVGPQYGHLCPNGHGMLPDHIRFCPHCGAEAIDIAPPAGKAVCAECGNLLEPGVRFCGNCGRAAPQAPERTHVGICPSCGEALTSSATFCPNCGHPLSADTEREGQAATPPPAPEPPAGTQVPVESEGLEKSVPQGELESAKMAQDTVGGTAHPPAEIEAPDRQGNQLVVCASCSAAVNPDAVFCPSCGQHIAAESSLPVFPEPEGNAPVDVPEPASDDGESETSEWEF